ncbi:MAG: hypothetical protein HOV77_25100 [Hamadaea sp.]|uniref:hypothetical protein n=1 Tax=Hamadaea sp. TaxID=2024425 RepID=UPI0018092387|nr:hypothetical protein [Hamadaea sp.]NUT22463.1 hypothetical protein [Hamadaea sp.]
MSFHDELSRKVYELVQIAWAGLAYDEDDEELRDGDDLAEARFIKMPHRDPAEVWEAFEYYFNTANPEDAADVSSDLVKAGRELYEAQTLYFAKISGRLTAWEGTAANAFKRHLDAVWWSATVHQSVLEQVGALYAAYVDLIAKARQDAISIADATIDTLKAYWRTKEQAQHDANLIAAGVVAGVAATMLTAGIAAPAVAAAGTAAAEASAEVVIESAIITSAKDAVVGLMAADKALTVSGSSPDEIVDELLRQLERARTDVRKQGKAIARGFRKALSVLTEPDFVPQPPRAAYESFDPEQFRVISSVMPDSLAVAASHDPLLVAQPHP